MNMAWPIIVVVIANTFYNLCAKSTPENASPFASLTVTYLTAAALSVVLFFATSQSKNMLSALQKSNWTAIAFGFSIVALEFGYIYIYRAGWNVSTGSLVANISLACVLLFVGMLLYRESISLHQLLGVALCAAGMILVSK